MLKGIIKRSTSLVLALVMFVSLLPVVELPAYAASGSNIEIVTGDNYEVVYSYNSDGSENPPEVTSSTNGFELTAYPMSTTSSSGCSGSTTTPYATYVTITFSSELDVAILSFTAESDVAIPGPAVLNDDVYSVTLLKGESYSIPITVVAEATSTTISIQNISAVEPEVSEESYEVAFLPYKEGTGTITLSDETGVYADGSIFTVSAEAEQGYVFVGWYYANGELYQPNATFTHRVDSAATFYAKFADASEANFLVGDISLAELSDAVAYAENNGEDLIVQTAKEYELVEEDIVIPSGVTLLLPYGTDYTVNDGNHEHPYANTQNTGTSTDKSTSPGDGANCIMYATDSTITVGKGAKFVIGGLHGYSSSGIAGQTYGAHGYLEMDSNSCVEVINEGILSVKGFITGGEVDSKGGQIYESFTIMIFTVALILLPPL